MSNAISKPYIPPFVTFGLPPSGSARAGQFGSLVTMGATPGITYTPQPPNYGERSTDEILHPPSVIENVRAFEQATKRIGAETNPFKNLAVNNRQDFDFNAYTSVDLEPFTYTGSDLRVYVDIPGTKGKQLLELTTITVSVHREKSPVRAVGYINPKGFARGRRTIGGTMILTQFYADILYRFLDVKWNQDISKDNPYKKPDQLPPFNLTFLFSDENGHGSYRRLLGVDCVTDGTVYSMQDLLTEQTLSFMASDFTPLLPIGVSATTFTNGVKKTEKTPRDARSEDLMNLPTRPMDLSLFAPNAEYVESTISFGSEYEG